MDEFWKTVGVLAAVGLFVSLGKILLQKDKTPIRIAVGKCILGSALSVAAAGILTLFPQLPILALVGVASGLSILGITWFEEEAKKYAEKYLNKGE